MTTGLLDGVAVLRDTATALLRADLTAPTDTDFLTALADLERVTRQLSTAMTSRMIIETRSRSITERTGFNATTRFLKGFLRLSGADAHRRVHDAQNYGPRPTVTGESLPSWHPHVTAGQDAGDIGVEHTQKISQVMRKIPHRVLPDKREEAELILANIARTAAPEDVTTVGDRILGHLDPDGKITDDHDRARRRSLRLSRQDADLMSTLTGSLDPATRALLDTVLSKWAAPGYNNPDDELSPRGSLDTPNVDPALLAECAGRDGRTQEMRNHDALNALLRWVIAAGNLGEHNGLPVHVIVTMTLQQLEQETGLASTATGGVIPVEDVLRMAQVRHNYLTLLDLDGRPLFFARSIRNGSRDQRMALFACEGGCTGPSCGTPAAGSQVHHRERDWACGGRTDITDLTLLCPSHNGAADTNDGVHIPKGWYSRIGAEGTVNAGRTEWIPPASVDPLRRAVVNNRHRPAWLLSAALQVLLAQRQADDDAWWHAWSATQRRHDADADPDGDDPGDVDVDVDDADADADADPGGADP